MESSATKSVLVASGSFCDALSALIRLKQEKKPNFSLNALGIKLGSKSRGYISDVLSGRRNFPVKRLDKLTEVFSLEVDEAGYLKLLLDLDRETKPELREQIVLDLQKMGKLLGQPVMLLSERIKSSAFALEVYSAFGLYGSKPTLRDLLKFFGRERILDLEKALRVLTNEGLIRRKGDQLESVDEKKGAISFKESPNSDKAPSEFARNALLDAARSVDHWYGEPDNAIVGTTILSCKSSEYAEKLKEFKQIIYKSHMELESSDADMLVRFNIMVYPAGRKPAAKPESK